MMRKWRILIVDDEEDIRAIVRAALSTKYEVVEAQDGLDALEKVKIAEPDFVVLDVMMPMMNGFETCEAIRKDPNCAGLSVLFLSALNTKEDMMKGYTAGANLYLTKPFDPGRLVRNIDLFFETNPPSPKKYRHTLEQLKEIEKGGAEAMANARAGTQGEPSAPAAAAATASAGATPVPPEKTTRPITGVPRVIVVDDEPDLVEIMRASLGESFEVVTAHDGLDAIEKITSTQPDMIVLDAMMPKMSGFQLCQSLRRNSRYARTPILLVSGKTSAKDKEYAARIGVNEFVPKPFDPAFFRERVESMMQLPTFKIYPKAMTFQAIQILDNKRRQDLEEKKDRLVRKQEDNELEKFLREHS